MTAACTSSTSASSPMRSSSTRADPPARSPTRSARWSCAARRPSVRRAAIGLALSAERIRGSRPYARRATLRGGANALINARPTAVNLRWAVERVMARYTEIGELSEDGEAIAAAMRAEADAIVMEATTDHGRLAQFGLEVAARPGGSPGPGADPLQHRPTRLRPVRDRAGRGPGGPLRGATDPRLGRRDPALPAGRAADHLGARARPASPTR